MSTVVDFKYKVAVILPIYNNEHEAVSIVEELKDFASKRKDYYFLFVDDGSTDNTFKKIKSAVERIENIAITGYSSNRGKGYAIKYGFHSTDAEYYCFIDSDLAYPLELIDTLLSRLQEVDVVIGSRKLINRTRRPNLLRHILGEGYNRLMRITLGLPYRDTQAGIKGLTKEAVHRILPKMSIDGFGFDAELLLIAFKEGLSIEEIPVKESDNHSYKTCKLKLAKDTVTMLRDLIRVRINNLTGRYD